MLLSMQTVKFPLLMVIVLAIAGLVTPSRSLSSSYTVKLFVDMT